MSTEEPVRLVAGRCVLCRDLSHELLPSVLGPMHPECACLAVAADERFWRLEVDAIEEDTHERE